MRIPIKKYVMDESLSWEERYRRLEAHHVDETAWMTGEIQRLEKQVLGLLAEEHDDGDED